MHVITEIDPKTGALFARNPYNTEFADRTAFFDVDEATRTVSGDRTEFLGRNGTLRSPAAMTRARLSGRVGAALDPCAAIQVPFDLADGQEREIIFRLGVGRDSDDARQPGAPLPGICCRARGARKGLAVLESHPRRSAGGNTRPVRQRAGQRLALIPDSGMPSLGAERILPVRRRIRFPRPVAGRDGAHPSPSRGSCASTSSSARPISSRREMSSIGGIPRSGRGVRTHCSDDFLWLPLAACRYVLITGDTGVLDETVRFIEGRPVNKDEDSYYDLPHASEETASLYDHCVRAILRGLSRGEHGLPLIGSGDWNDGMNLVGEHGKGESVWLGFFLYEVLVRFC